jgi:hypothetical protein
MKKIAVKVLGKAAGDYQVFAIVSPKGGVRVVGSDMQLPSDAPLFETLAAGARLGSIELTLAEMTRIAELGVAVEASASAVQAPVVEAPVEQVAPRSRPLEAIQAAVMEMDQSGYFHEVGVAKHAHQCLGCGLVWQIKWHADSCADRGHKSHWQQRYYSGAIINGKPEYERFFDRVALRRESIA